MATHTIPLSVCVCCRPIHVLHVYRVNCSIEQRSTCTWVKYLVGDLTIHCCRFDPDEPPRSYLQSREESMLDGENSVTASPGTMLGRYLGRLDFPSHHQKGWADLLQISNFVPAAIYGLRLCCFRCFVRTTPLYSSSTCNIMLQSIAQLKQPSPQECFLPLFGEDCSNSKSVSSCTSIWDILHMYLLRIILCEVNRVVVKYRVTSTWMWFCGTGNDVVWCVDHLCCSKAHHSRFMINWMTGLQ